jgi:hypothetical protein
MYLNHKAVHAILYPATYRESKKPTYDQIAMKTKVIPQKTRLSLSH